MAKKLQARVQARVSTVVLRENLQQCQAPEKSNPKNRLQESEELAKADSVENIIIRSVQCL